MNNQPSSPSGIPPALLDGGGEFSAAFMAIQSLSRSLGGHQDSVGKDIVHALGKLLFAAKYERRRNGPFLYREAASLLGDVAASSGDSSTAALALRELDRAVRTGKIHSCLAAAHALGRLPSGSVAARLSQAERDFARPMAAVPKNPPTTRMDWKALCGIAGADPDSLRLYGRSLIAGIPGGDTVLVFKSLRAGEDPYGILLECRWMSRLSRLRASGWMSRVRFDVPAPLAAGEDRLFRVSGIPRGAVPEGEAVGVAYVASLDYFLYPNDPDRLMAAPQLSEVLERSARLFGSLASIGVVHTAPVPLFHNRVQRDRRDDGGLYQWHRMGRLDRWFHSCLYPNFGASGLRDFEHFVTVPEVGGRTFLYHQVGAHLLSLALVAASWFRCRDITRMGTDESGKAVDARDLFDARQLREFLKAAFRGYFEGITGEPFQGEIPFDLEVLSEEMVDAMGMDRHMDEILRLPDQEAMTDSEFRLFLSERGYPRGKLERAVRGLKEIRLSTGPHLGGFNSRISIPRLAAFAGSAAACCMAARFRQARNLNRQEC